MGTSIRHWIAGAAGVAVAAAVNVTTGMLTQRWAAPWFAATIALVLVGGGLEVLLGGRPSARQRISRTRVGGDVSQRLSGVGEQSVIDSDVGRSLDQSQGTGGDDP